MISFAISLTITVLVYGLGPILLLAFRRSPISPKKLKWFHIIYTVVISLIFNLSSAMLGYGCNFTPALIWGWIFYNINKSQFKKRNPSIPQDTYTQQEAQMKRFAVDESTGEVISEQPAAVPQADTEPQPIVLSYKSDYELPVHLQPVEDPVPPEQPQSTPQKLSAKGKIICSVLAILCVASLAGNAVQVYLSSNAEAQLAKLEKDLADKDALIQSLKKSRSTLQKQLSDAIDDSDATLEMLGTLAPEAFALETHIGFIYDGSKYCHRYYCSQFPFEDCASDGFYAHNVEYCEWLGYPKHSQCWG